MCYSLKNRELIFFASHLDKKNRFLVKNHLNLSDILWLFLIVKKSFLIQNWSVMVDGILNISTKTFKYSNIWRRNELFTIPLSSRQTHQNNSFIKRNWKVFEWYYFGWEPWNPPRLPEECSEQEVFRAGRKQHKPKLLHAERLLPTAKHWS